MNDTQLQPTLGGPVDWALSVSLLGPSPTVVPAPVWWPSVVVDDEVMSHCVTVHVCMEEMTCVCVCECVSMHRDGRTATTTQS